MPEFGYVLFYVDSPEASADFYQRLFGMPPVERAPTFALFVLPNGTKLGLWSRHTVEPPPAAGGGGGVEIGFVDPDVDAAFARWQAMGLTILQAPTDMDFARTFVAADPDGHRLRVLAPPV